jgi:hypothetical protein
LLDGFAAFRGFACQNQVRLNSDQCGAPSRAMDGRRPQEFKFEPCRCSSFYLLTDLLIYFLASNSDSQERFTVVV